MRVPSARLGGDTLGNPALEWIIGKDLVKRRDEILIRGVALILVLG